MNNEIKTETKKDADPKHYVNNKELYEAMKVWKDEIVIKGKENTVMPNVVAHGIVKIANNLTRRYNFVLYTTHWKEEMVCDAIENCMKSITNFDTDKYKNVYGYITRICFNAFVLRIKREKKETALKYKMFLYDANEYSEGELDLEFYHQMLNRVNEYEASKMKPEKPEPINLQKFLKEI